MAKPTKEPARRSRAGKAKAPAGEEANKGASVPRAPKASATRRSAPEAASPVTGTPVAVIQLPIGYQNPASASVTDLRLPMLEDIDARALIFDAINAAVTSRKGQVVLGEKGIGKSMALATALRDFAELEKAQRERDPKYQVRNLVLVRNMRAKTLREAAIFVWRRVLGVEPQTRIKGRVRNDDEIMAELVTHLLKLNVAALVFDEAEHLSRAALDMLRDIMSLSESSAKTRIDEAGYGSAGVGAVLIGTPRARRLVDESEERGQRFTSIRYAGGLSAEVVADAYRRLVPAFEDAAKKMGDRKWGQLIGEVVTRGSETVSLRVIENHVRQYALRMNTIKPGSGSNIGTLTWNQDVFRYAASELVRE